VEASGYQFEFLRPFVADFVIKLKANLQKPLCVSFNSKIFWNVKVGIRFNFKFFKEKKRFCVILLRSCKTYVRRIQVTKALATKKTEQS